MIKTGGHNSETLAMSQGGNDEAWQKMADEVLSERGNNSEPIEKEFYETEVEFSPENIKAFREKILSADSETTRQILDKRIDLLEKTCDDVESISPGRFDQHLHRGYIGSKTSVQFEGYAVSMGSWYKLKNTDYLYEAVSRLQNNRESIKNSSTLFNNIEGFLNSYFGVPDADGVDRRMEVIDRRIDLNDPEIDDDEYFDRLENIDISIFKNEHVAQCSERAAMAQNIMSMFGYETYYANGDVSIDEKPDFHAYNIVADASERKYIIDYSVTSLIEYRGTDWLVPTQSKIPDFEAFQRGEKVKSASYKGHVDEDGKINRKIARRLEYGMM